MRILHILDHSIPLHSGYTFRTRSILEHQRALGWKTFHVTSPKQGKVKAAVEDVDNLKFYRSPVVNGWKSRVPFTKQLSIVPVLRGRIEEVIEEVKPDILHAHSPSLNGLAALKAARRNNLPLVYEVRAFWEDAAVDHGTSKEWGVRYRLTRASETLVLRNANAVTTICEGLRGEMIAVRGIPEEKITVIPNAVNIDMFTDNPIPDVQLMQELNLSGRTVIGFIGSFYAYEGLDLLIQAMKALKERGSNVCLLLVGGGPEEDSLKAQVSNSGLESSVIFTGRVHHDEVKRYYSLIDILAYPRHKMRLTDLVTPLKPLEAMAQHKLVLASDVGGHRELICDGKTGFLFEHGNAHALSNKVLELMNEESCWPAVRCQAREFVEKERSWGVSVSRYKSVYGKLV